MPTKKTCKSFPQKLAQALMALLLIMSGGVILPHQAHSQDDLRGAAKAVVFSPEQSMGQIVNTYPFLQDDFQKMTAMQNSIAENMNSDHSVEISTRISIAESRDAQTGVNILFVRKKGELWCGSRGCRVDIYVDEGSGYQKANAITASDNISISRAGGQVALFFGPPQDPKTVEWILQGYHFVPNNPG